MWGAIFPGQGSQHPGMGEFLYKEFALARQIFEEASDTLGIDFKKLCFQGSEADLALTENTQPSLLLVSTATYRVIESITDFKPQCAAGHSIGEYAAVVAAGSLAFTSALKAVRQRGQAMQAAVPLGRGGMVAVMGLTPHEVTTVCRWAEMGAGDIPLEPANFNAPGQIVISGKQDVIDWLQANFKPEAVFGENKKVRLIPLKVSAPFHCSLMKPAEDEMRRILNEMSFSEGRFPVIQNFSATAETEGDKLREHLIRQVSAPVRWVECVQLMPQMKVDTLIEFGCGKVLSGLVKKIDSERLTTFNVNSLEDLKTVEKRLTEGGSGV
jgi:[acyl-carrier-protein] S-malonyltransferase